MTACCWDSLGNTDRKAMIRLVIDQVVLDQRRARGMVWMRIVWQTGAASEHWIKRRTQSYDEAAQIDLIEQRIRELNAVGLMDAEVAATLNAEGLLNCRGGRLPIELSIFCGCAGISAP